MFANSQNNTIFALQQSYNSDANHRIYNKRLGVVYPCSNSVTISGCCKLGKATLSLYLILMKFKFFTNATTSKKFSTAEREYAATNALPSDRAQTTISTQSIKKKELGKATLLPAIGLLFREFYRYVRCVPAQVVQDFFQSIQCSDYLRTDQRQGILCQGRDLPTGIPASNGTTAPVPATGSLYRHSLRIHLFPFINY